MKELKLYYGMMGYNRLDELKKLKTIHSLIDSVDQFIYVDGSCGTDGTEEWINKEFPDAPILVVHNKWSDDFPGQRNMYLNLVNELKSEEFDNWVVVNDTDEVFSNILGKNIKAVIEKGRITNDMLLVRSKSVTMRGDEEIYANMDDFYKPLIFRHYTNMMYWADRSEVTGNKTALHEALRCNDRFVWRPIKIEDDRLYYSHIKEEGIIWERGCRNFIVFGGGPNLGEKQPLWKPFRELLTSILGEYTSYDVLEYFKKGNIDQRIKDWMILHKDDDGYDGASEVRETGKVYFELYHPEEKSV